MAEKFTFEVILYYDDSVDDYESPEQVKKELLRVLRRSSAADVEIELIEQETIED